MKLGKKLPEAEALLVLGLLRGGGKSSGELAAMLEEEGETRFRMREGSLCAALHALEQSGHVRCEKCEEVSGLPGGARRRRYGLTRKGRHALAQAAERRQPPRGPREGDRSEAGVAEAPEKSGGFPEDFESWSERALKPLRFPPDRRRAREELAIHFQDRVRANGQAGMSGRESVEAALAMLGEPEETGRLLRKLHSPWQGWGLRVARLVLILLLIAVWKADMDAYDLRFMSRTTVLQYAGISVTRAYDDAEVKEQVIARCPGSCSDEADFGPWQVSCERVSFQWIRRKIGGIYNYETTDRNSVVLLRFTAAPWHRLGEDFLKEALRVTDGEGNALSDDYSWERPSYQVEICRVRPWETVVILKFYALDYDTERLDLILRQQDKEARLQVALGEWGIAVEELPRMGDGAEAVRQAAADPPELYTCGMVTAPDALSQRLAAPTGTVRAGGKELCVRWARQCHYREDPVKVQEYNRMVGEEWGSGSEWKHTATEAELVECVLELRGDIFGFPPIENTMDSETLRITAAGPEGESEPLDWHFSEHAIWYADGCLLRLQWAPVDGADRYELRWTEETGESCTLTIAPGEEESLT